MSILFTGFEPFGGDAVNPSWEAVSLLPERIAGEPVIRLRLPVVYGKAGELLREAVCREGPALVFCTGLAAGRKAVTPELVALNWRMAAVPDNAGALYDGELIEPEGPAALRTALPVKRMIAAVKEAGLPCALSLSAGSYVCNDLYWALLRLRGENGPDGIFIHVPGTDVLSPEESARALRLCAEAALS